MGENIFKGAKVLVTGGAGFIGTNLILRLLSLGAHVTATLHTSPPKIEDKPVDFVRCDLRNKNDCERATSGQEYVFMCAAETSGAGVIESKPLIHLTDNVMMNTALLEAAYKAKAKKVAFISSNIVYPQVDRPVQENDAEYSFFHKYYIAGWMKRFTEITCDIYARKIDEPMNVCVVRPGNIYGEYDDFAWETSHVIPALVRKVVERQNPVEIWGDGEDLKDFIYIQDFLDGLISVMSLDDDLGPINIASGTPTTVREVLNMLLEIEGFEDAQIVFDTSKPTMIPKRLIDTSYAEKKLGFRSRISLEEGLRKTLEWYKSNQVQ